MNRFYLMDYLKENSKLDKNILDALKSNLDSKIYYYGDHFKYPNEIKALIIVKNANWDLLKKIIALSLVGAKNLSRSLRNNWFGLIRNKRQELFKKEIGLN